MTPVGPAFRVCQGNVGVDKRYVVAQGDVPRELQDLEGLSTDTGLYS